MPARYDTKMDGNEWMEVSSDGIPLCRIKYNGQFLSNADQNLSDEYRSKIADIQDEISTVREYVGLYEHAPQMKAADVSDYRQLAAFGDTVLAATYSEKNGFMFCTWKQNADGDSVFWGDYSPNYEYVMGFSSLSIYSLNLFRKGGQRICRMAAVSISGIAALITVICVSAKRKPTPRGLKFGTAVISRSICLLWGSSENMVIVCSPCCEIKKALRFLCNRRAIDSITYSVAGLPSVQRSAARLQVKDIRP